MSSAILGRFSGVGWTLFWFHFVYSLPVSFLSSLLGHSLCFLFVLLSFPSTTLYPCPFFFFFLSCLLVSVTSWWWCNFPPSFHPSPKFLPSPFSLSHPPSLLTFLPYFLSPLHVSVVLPFYFHFLLNSISLGSSFLPSSFFPVYLSYSGLSFLLPTLLLLFLSLQSLLSLLPSLHLVFSLLPCFHLTSFVIMSPRTSYFPFIFPSLHPPSVLLSSLHSFMSCSLSLQYLFCCSSFWILFTSPYPSYFHYFLHLLSSLFPLFRLWLFTFFLHQCFFTLFSS